MTAALEGGERSASRPGRSLPQGKTQYPLYRRLGGPQGRSGQVRKISTPPEFDPRTVQPVASRYTHTHFTNCPKNMSRLNNCFGTCWFPHRRVEIKLGNFSDHAGISDYTHKPSDTDSLHYIHALREPQCKNQVTYQLLRWPSPYKCWASWDSSTTPCFRLFTCFLTRIVYILYQRLSSYIHTNAVIKTVRVLPSLVNLVLTMNNRR